MSKRITSVLSIAASVSHRLILIDSISIICFLKTGGNPLKTFHESIRRNTLLIFFLSLSLSLALNANDGLKDPNDYQKNSDLQYKWAMESLDAFPFEPSDKVLDLGCGTGEITVEVADRLPSGIVIGLDISKNILNYASEHFPSANIIVEALAKTDAWAHRLPNFQNKRVYYSADEYQALLENAGFFVEKISQDTTYTYFKDRAALTGFFRPLCTFLSSLSSEQQTQFVDEIVDEVLKTNPLQEDGSILLHDLKLEAIISKPSDRTLWTLS